MDIYFHSQRGPYGYLSNFYKNHPIEVDGKTWPTTEHYYQAMKFQDNPQLIEKIRSVDWAGYAKEIAHKNYHLFDADRFFTVKHEVMYKALVAKFNQYPTLKQKLLSTEDNRIVEHAKIDSYWGDGGDDTGKNMLGRILMRLRAELGGAPYIDNELDELLCSSQE